MCAGCHSIDTATSAIHSRQEWRSIVDDMVARGARGNSHDADVVVNYLSAQYGRGGTDSVAAIASAGTINGPAAAKHFEPGRHVAVTDEWPVYGHDPGGQRYSPAASSYAG